MGGTAVSSVAARNVVACDCAEGADEASCAADGIRSAGPSSVASAQSD